MVYLLLMKGFTTITLTENIKDSQNIKNFKIYLHRENTFYVFLILMKHSMWISNKYTLKS